MSKISRMIPGAVAKRMKGSAAPTGEPGAANHLEAQRADLAARRDRLAARVEANRAAAEVAAGRVRSILTADVIDEEVLAKAERARDDAAASFASADEALEDLSRQVNTIGVEIARLADQARRERDASDLAERLAEMEAAAAGMLAPIAALGDAYERFRLAAHGAMPTTSVRPFGAGVLIGEVREHVLHELFPRDHGRPTLSTAPSAAALIATIVRDLAGITDAVRSGAVALPEPVPSYGPPPIFTEMPVVLSREAFFANAIGQRIDIPRGGVMLPAPIAAEAIQQGVGFPFESADGRAIVAILQSQPAGQIERGEDGRFIAVRSRGMSSAAGQDGTITPPTLPAANLGSLPGASDLAEAAE